ncbi:MAG TPA: efflux RND transporter permease subunit [bacterium]|nr:efflux RND transporter permease subunit [bacterium]
MRKIITFMIKNPMVVNMLVVGILVVGMMYTLSTRKETFPSTELDIISVSVPFPGASAAETEEGITIKVEESLDNVTGIDYIESTSAEGYSSVVIYLKTSVKNPRKVLDDVQDAVAQIYTFPDDAEEPNIALLENRSQEIAVAIYGEGLDEKSLKALAEEIRDELLEIEVISNVSIDGIRDLEMAIEVSEKDMQRYGITFNEITNAVQSYDFEVSAGTIKTNSEKISLRVAGKNYRPEDLSKIVLRALRDGTVIRLRDVANVVEEFKDDDYRFLFNGKPAAMVWVKKTEAEDTIKITTAVKKYITEKAPTLPENVKIQYTSDMSKILGQRIDLLVKNGKYAICLIFILLMIFLGLNLSFWVAMGLPIALMMTMIFIRPFDITINMMSLFGFLIMLGILVDDSIVVAENIQQYIEKGYDPKAAAVEATVEVYPAVLASVTTTIIAFSPFFFIAGIFGKFLKPIPFVAAFGLAASLLECLFILPPHLAHSLRPISERKNATGFFARTRRAMDRAIQFLVDYTYKPVLKFAIRFKWQTVVTGFVIFILAIGVTKSGILRFVFFPEIDSEFIRFSYTLEPGSPLTVHDRIQDHVYKQIDIIEEEFKEIRRDFLKTRKGKRFAEKAGPDSPFIVQVISVKGGSFGSSNTSTGYFFVEMLDGEARGISSKVVLDRLRELIGENLPGVIRTDFSAAMGPGSGAAIQIQLAGKDSDELMRSVGLVKDWLREFPAVYDVQDDIEWGNRELSLDLNENGKALGLTLRDIALQTRYGFYGQEIHRVQRGKDEIKVWVRYPKEERDSLGDFDSIKVRTATGVEVPLSDVVTIESNRRIRQINRFNKKRVFSVSAKVDFAQLSPDTLKNEARDKLPALLEQVHGVTFSLEGSDRFQQQLMKSLMFWYPVAIILIFVIITLTFRNYLHSAMIMVMIPLGFAGAVVGHLIVPLMNSRIDRLDLSMLSIAGVVALAGIVVNDSIVMTHAIKRNISSGDSLSDSVFNGAVSRFRPIVLTTLTTSIGMMPLILETSLQAQFLIPMACSIAFGLIVATFFTQLWLPAGFLVLNDAKRMWYLMAKGKLYKPEVIERNGLPEGNFIKGVIPWWMIAAVAGFVIFAAVYLGYIKLF